MWQNNNRFSWFPCCPQLHKSPVFVTQAEIKYFKLSNNPVVWNVNSHKRQMLYKVANALCSVAIRRMEKMQVFRRICSTLFFLALFIIHFRHEYSEKVEAFRYLYANAKIHSFVQPKWCCSVHPKWCCSENLITFHWFPFNFGAFVHRSSWTGFDKATLFHETTLLDDEPYICVYIFHRST